MTPSTCATRSSRRYAAAVAAPPDAKRLAEAKSNARYSFARRLDNTETIAGTLARFVRYSRSYGTVNRLYRVYDSLTPDDVQAAAKTYFTDVEPRRRDAVEGGASRTPWRQPPALAAVAPKAAAEAADLDFVIQKTTLPQLNIKLLFAAGSAHDPKGKEGLAALAAVDDRRGRLEGPAHRRDQPRPLPDGRQLPRPGRQGDDHVHRRRSTATTAKAFLDIVLPQLLDPGFREEDFDRLKDAAEERPRRGPARQQRGGARQGAAPGEHLRRHALRPPRARHRRRHPGDHPRRREGLRPDGVHTSGPHGRRRRRRAAGDPRPRSKTDLARLPDGPALADARRASSATQPVGHATSRSSRRTRAPPRSPSATRSP